MAVEAAQKYLTHLLQKSRTVVTAQTSEFFEEARKAGFEFEPEEWSDVVASQLEAAQGGQKLSDDDLDTISGGGAGTPGTGFATCPATSSGC
jgi:hypothetical protein